ncbi:MAG TPA: hypothetical protein VGR53_04930 [Nitrososphaerales archaeon]|nr:hypothetical protein [Nitrososphaerales archaeon]
MKRRVWPRFAEIPSFSREAEVRVYPSGERRIAKDPPPEVVRKAFDELGTHNAVAAAFGVTRHVVTRWILQYGLNVTSRPEIRHANFVRKCLENRSDRIRVAQWVVDEGTVGVTYFARGDYTSLLVCGSMNDCDAIGDISSILQTPTLCTKSGHLTTLPLQGVRMLSSKAYVLLEILLPELQGLKAMEARAALSFFPRTGIVLGRHTTDEFMASVWEEFARKSLISWNAKRRQKLANDELETRVRSWVEGRIRRARRFIDSPQHSE